MYDFVENEAKSCMYKWANNSIIVFFIWFANEILLIKNDIPTLHGIKIWLSFIFFIKVWKVMRTMLKYL